MTRDPKYDILFDPVQIGPKTLKNRFYQTPHCTSFGVDAPGAQARLRGVKAEGGWAAVSTEYCSIHPEGDDSPHIGARLWDDADVRNLSAMCDAIHEHDALAGVELFFGGAHGTNYESRLVPRGVSQIPDENSTWGHSCFAMDKPEIRELQSFYVAAARRARAAGFDIVNIHGNAGSITQHFLMRYFNKRTDEYGGTFENRARFWLETIEQVKEAVGADCAIAVRMCIDTLDESLDGLKVDEEGVGFIALADHLVDLWDLQAGGWGLPRWGEEASPSRFAGENFQGALLAQVRPHTRKPIVGIGRFTHPEVMVDVIRSGQQDIIGCARPSIADPFLPRKIEEGHLDDIRECIGCNVCASRFNQTVPIVCTQNATMGEEYRRGWHPEMVSAATNAENDVLVIGAGPAGMECALMLGKRGMRRVHLVDANSEMGGIMRWVPRLPGLGEWARVVDYRKIQIAKLKNVVFVPNTTLDVNSAIEYGAEIVIAATGSRWAVDGLNGATRTAILGADANLPHCLTPEQIMVEGKHAGERVLVYDCEGYFMGVSLAERLALEGKTVTYVTHMATVAPHTAFTHESTGIRKKLQHLGVTLVTGHVLTEIKPGAALGHPTFDAQAPVEWPVDGVVLVTQRRSDDGLHRDLRARGDGLLAEGITGLYRIGDCVAPRLIADCIFDGHRLAREIDTDDPATPRPYIRERRVLGARDADYDAVLAGR